MNNYPAAPPQYTETMQDEAMRQTGSHDKINLVPTDYGDYGQYGQRTIPAPGYEQYSYNPRGQPQPAPPATHAPPTVTAQTVAPPMQPPPSRVIVVRSNFWRWRAFFAVIFAVKIIVIIIVVMALRRR